MVLNSDLVYLFAAFTVFCYLLQQPDTCGNMLTLFVISFSARGRFC